MHSLWSAMVNNPEVTSAIGSVFSTVTAMIALLFSIIGLNIQRRHNRLSICPRANIIFGNYENNVFVKIKNNGIGPLVIKNHYVNIDGRKYIAFIEYISEKYRGFVFDDYSESINGRIIASSEEIVIIKYTVNLADNDDIEAREILRSELGKANFVVEYQDLYKRDQPPCIRSGEWFNGVIDS